MTCIRPRACGANVRGALSRLWLHEHARVYGDRLVDAADVAWLCGLLSDVARAKLECRGAGAPGGGDEPLFGAARAVLQARDGRLLAQAAALTRR